MNPLPDSRTACSLAAWMILVTGTELAQADSHARQVMQVASRSANASETDNFPWWTAWIRAILPRGESDSDRVRRNEGQTARHEPHLTQRETSPCSEPGDGGPAPAFTPLPAARRVVVLFRILHSCHGRIVTGVPMDTTLYISSTSAFSRAMHPSVQFIGLNRRGTVALPRMRPWMPTAPPSFVSQGGCCRSSFAFLISMYSC